MARFISSLVSTSLLVAHVAAQTSTLSVVGTWSTKSQSVITGPTFYNYTYDRFIEPSLTGVSYTFTADGHYEEAYYQTVSNPTKPTCPQGQIQWQHGTYEQAANSSMILTPISVDGRQLTSNPCVSKSSTLAIYDQPETFSLVKVYIDPFNNQPRMDIYGFDGSPYNPMWINNTTPQLCPTSTITSPQAAQSAGVHSEEKRSFDLAGQARIQAVIEPLIEQGYFTMSRLLWFGMGTIGIGSALVFYS